MTFQEYICCVKCSLHPDWGGTWEKLWNWRLFREDTTWGCSSHYGGNECRQSSASTGLILQLRLLVLRSCQWEKQRTWVMGSKPENMSFDPLTLQRKHPKSTSSAASSRSCDFASPVNIPSLINILKLGLSVHGPIHWKHEVATLISSHSQLQSWKTINTATQ